MPKNFKYVQQSEGVIGSYDSTDLIKGVGYINFHGCLLDGTAGTSGALVTDTIWSKTKSSAIVLIDYEQQISSNVYFPIDVQITQPLTVGGIAFVNAPVGIYYNGGGGTVAFSMNATLEKVSGSTITSISDTSSGAFLTATLAAGQSDFAQLACTLNVTSTRFKRGDILRLKVKQTSVTAPNSAYLFINPKNTTYSSPTDIPSTDLQLSMPFKIDL